MINRLVVTKLWVNGHACEDRDEWTEEVRAIANAVTTTKRKLLRYRPRGFDDKGSVVIDVWPFKVVGLRSRWARFCGHEVRC